MDKSTVLARLAEDKPLFHHFDDEGVQRAALAGVVSTPGDVSWAVSAGVLSWIADHITPEMHTIETGAGHTTVLLAALAREHHCCTYSAVEAEKIRAYLDRIGVPQSKLTFSIGSTDATLPALDADARFDFAYIDGCHGYPFPSLDWHYLDKHLKSGGTVGMDNVELRPVREHCEFLEENGVYEFIGAVSEGYFVRFYRKLRDQQREWIDQAYSRAKKDPCDSRLPTRIRRKASKVIKPHLF